VNDHDRTAAVLGPAGAEIGCDACFEEHDSLRALVGDRPSP